MSLASFRDEFDVARGMSYLANGSVAPAARSVLAASRAWQDHWARDPQVAYRTYHDRKEDLRRAIADVIGADPDEVAITENASRGASLAVRLLAKRRGSHVVVDRTTYPSSRYPWLTETTKRLRHVDDGGESGPGAVVAALDDDAAAVSVSYVDWASGVRHDVAALAKAAHDRGALLIADASQAVGAVPVDVRRDGIDVLYGTFGKWLLAGPGLGFLYVRKALMDAGPVLDPGWKNLCVDGRDWPGETMPAPVAGGQRFEPGLPNLNGMIMALAGLALLKRAGMDAVHREIAALAGRARDGLADLGLSLMTPAQPERRAGLIAFDHPDAVALAAYLRERKVEITGYKFGIVRVDPHAYNTAEEIDIMLRLVEEFQGAFSSDRIG